MRIVRHWRNPPTEARGAVVAIGNFDGVHLGHRAVIEAARTVANAEGTPLAVLTFEPHPRQVLAPKTEPFRLTPLRIKARALSELGVDVLFVARFDKTFAAQTPDEFVENVIVEGVGARHVVVGYDFAFGRKRAGNVALLEAFGERKGFGMTQVQAAGDGERTYSASEARRLLGTGDVGRIPQILGRHWEIDGRVSTGDRRGRTIGFPTANLGLDGILHPARGVYALWAGVPRGEGVQWLPAVANLGKRPTFDKTVDLLEIHIFDFEGDLYGRRLRARFVERVRAERKFDGLEALRAQITKDCAMARNILAASAPPAPPAATDAEPARLAGS